MTADHDLCDVVELDVTESADVDATTDRAWLRFQTVFWRNIEAASRGHLTRTGLRLAARKVLPLSLMAILAALAVVSSVTAIRSHVLGFDFLGTMWDPSRAIVRGHSPFPLPTVSAIETGNPAIYPPLLPVLAVPLGALPWGFALAIWTSALVVGVAFSVWLAGARDWRCFVVALFSPLIVGGLVFGNIVLLLIVGVSVSWRWRERPAVSGLALGLTIAAKLVAWPLLVWLLISRRYQAFGYACGALVAGILIPWALVGFRGIRDYPTLLRLADRVYGPHGFSLAASAAALGVSNLGVVFCLAATATALTAAATFGRKREFDVFAFAVLATVFVAPIAWPYSFSLLLPCVAAARPRFSYAWGSFGLLFIVAGLVPHSTVAIEPCCRPTRVPQPIWDFNHLSPSLWVPLAFAASATLVVLASIRVSRSRSEVST